VYEAQLPLSGNRLYSGVRRLRGACRLTSPDPKMPSTVETVMTAAGLQPGGSVLWGERVPEDRPGVYVVALTRETGGVDGPLPECPIENSVLQLWLTARPELRLDNRRPTLLELRERIAAFWLPDEVLLYIGLTTRPLSKRVHEYYETPLGDRKPHAGGHFLKTLSNLSELFVHYASTDTPTSAEDGMLKAFCRAVSRQTLNHLIDPDHPFPFANLEWPRGHRKRHGLTGSKESRR